MATLINELGDDDRSVNRIKRLLKNSKIPETDGIVTYLNEA